MHILFWTDKHFSEACTFLFGRSCCSPLEESQKNVAKEKGWGLYRWRNIENNLGGNLLSHIYNNTLCSYCGNITTDENTDCSRFPKEMIYVQCAFITLLIKTNQITFVLFPNLRLCGNQHLLQTLIGEGCKILQMEIFGVQTLLV